MHEVDAVDDASQLDGGAVGEFEEGRVLLFHFDDGERTELLVVFQLVLDVGDDHTTNE